MYQKIVHKRYQGRRFRILILLALVLFASATLLWHFKIDFFSPSSNFDEIIREAAGRHCVDFLLVKAVIWRESRFRSLVRGSEGEIGLMQIMPGASVIDWARSKGVEVPSEAALYSPRLNVEIGTWYLARAMRRWGEYKDVNAFALAEYNAGRSAVQRWKPDSYEGNFVDRIEYPSTKSYVIDILRKYEDYAINRKAQ